MVSCTYLEVRINISYLVPILKPSNPPPSCFIPPHATSPFPCSSSPFLLPHPDPPVCMSALPDSQHVNMSTALWASANEGNNKHYCFKFDLTPIIPLLCIMLASAYFIDSHQENYAFYILSLCSLAIYFLLHLWQTSKMSCWGLVGKAENDTWLLNNWGYF